MTDQEAAAATTSVAIAVMCEPPIATGDFRLTPPLSTEEVAALCTCFIADLAATIGGLDPALNVRGVAAFAPTYSEEALRGLLPPAFTLLPQRGDTRGERCAAVVADLLAAGYAGVCLLDADSPTLPASLLHDAVAALSQPGERVVLGPALDGGYTLIGLRRACPELFDGIDWRTPRVLAQTIARAKALSLSVESLLPWYDVDDRLELTWLIRELLGDGIAPVASGRTGAGAPRTRAYLAALGQRGDGPPADPNLRGLPPGL
ncbi:MAG: DUF2064 domain-containing protein [Rhodospirillales bacterium]